LTDFDEALLEAKGLSFGEGSGQGLVQGGRTLSDVATVQGNGKQLIGKAYTALLELNPGDEFEIKLERQRSPLPGCSSDPWPRLRWSCITGQVRTPAWV
jgi:hypothetical protein